MQSVTTLASTTFASDVGANDTQVNLTSTSGIYPGVCLFANREQMVVVRINPVGSVSVRRGTEGTVTMSHRAGVATVYIGRGDQFYVQDPNGNPADAPYVQPYINIVTGTLWMVQGDDPLGNNQYSSIRRWAPVTTTQTVGPLGVRVDTVTTPS